MGGQLGFSDPARSCSQRTSRSLIALAANQAETAISTRDRGLLSCLSSTVEGHGFKKYIISRDASPSCTGHSAGETGRRPTPRKLLSRRLHPNCGFQAHFGRLGQFPGGPEDALGKGGVGVKRFADVTS